MKFGARREIALKDSLSKAQKAAERHAKAALVAMDEVETLRRQISVWLPTGKSVVSHDGVYSNNESSLRPEDNLPSWCSIDCCAGEICALAGRCLSLEQHRWTQVAKDLVGIDKTRRDSLNQRSQALSFLPFGSGAFPHFSGMPKDPPPRSPRPQCHRRSMQPRFNASHVPVPIPLVPSEIVTL